VGVFGTSQRAVLYPSSLIDYLRLFLLAEALFCHARGNTAVFVGLVTVSFFLDLMDGWIAQRLGQTSRFGEFLDFGTDLTTHTVLWVVSGFPFALVMILLEWSAGISVLLISIRQSDHWKIALMEAHPFLRRYFANRQRNWLAAWAGVSHFGFRFAWYLGYGETWVSDVTLPGIILFELVSAYMVWIPIRAWFYSRKNTTLDDRK